jgi:hypothetical protein
MHMDQAEKNFILDNVDSVILRETARLFGVDPDDYRNRMDLLNDLPERALDYLAGVAKKIKRGEGVPLGSPGSPSDSSDYDIVEQLVEKEDQESAWRTHGGYDENYPHGDQWHDSDPFS